MPLLATYSTGRAVISVSEVHLFFLELPDGLKKWKPYRGDSDFPYFFSSNTGTSDNQFSSIQLFEYILLPICQRPTQIAVQKHSLPPD
jgi:hypothetical protein